MFSKFSDDSHDHGLGLLWPGNVSNLIPVNMGREYRKEFTMNSCNLIDPITKKEYVRVSKPMANKLHAARVTYLMSPNNLYPFGGWRPYMEVFEERLEVAFTFLVNHFVSQNCLNTETGKFASFYVEKELLNKFKGEQS